MTIIKDVDNGIKHSTWVEHNGRYYYVDSTHLEFFSLANSSYETMIFECDKSLEHPDFGNGLYCERYNNLPEMQNGHQYVIDNFEKIIGK